jgi:anti-sigma factor RsiW
MDCKECAENLTAFLDGELRASNSAEIQRHLDICPSCAGEMRSLKEAVEYIESHYRDLEPRLESWNMVRARLSAEDSKAWFHFFAPNRWRIVMASLAIVAALGIGHLQYQRVQMRDLQNYISQYIQEREARSQAQSVQWNAEANFQIEAPFDDNPFVEISAVSVENPFISELSPEEE